MNPVYVMSLLICMILVFTSTDRVSSSEILWESEHARVVTGDRAAWLTRGLHAQPEPAEIPPERMATLVDSVAASLDHASISALADGVRRFGWAQRETEPVGSTDRVKVRVWAIGDSIVVRNLDEYDRVTAEAVLNIRDLKIRTTKYELGTRPDRTVFGVMLSPEMWIAQQEHLQKQFFESIMDLTYPGLETARTAYNEGKQSLALYEVAEYYRRKTAPESMIRQPVNAPATATHPASEKVVAGIFEGDGFTVDMGESLDWQTHPKGAPAEEWLWSFNTHRHFVTLLEGYLSTANEQYAEEYVRQITDFIIRCPAPPYSITRTAAWRNLEAGDRASITWPTAFYGFLSSPSFSPQALQIVLTGLWSHGNYIYHHPAGLRRPSNWSIIDSSGLCGVALFFPEFRDAESWRVTGFDRLTQQLRLQVYDDGFQYELAPSYHLYSLRRFQRAMNLAEQSGNTLPEDFSRIVESMYAVVMWLAKPDGSQPALSDSGPGSIRSTLSDASRRFGREDFLYVATGGQEGAEPDQTSVLLPDAGYAVMRSGWDTDARYLLFDGGPAGSGHQHEDKLSILVSAYGVNFLVDTGPFVYRATKWREHAVSTAAHSTVLIDGVGQNRIDNGKEHYAHETPVPHWESNSERDYVVAHYDAGYGVQGIPVIHRRHVQFKKPDFWIIVDEFHGEGEHEIETLFQFAPGLDVTTSNTATVTAQSEAGPRLVIQSADSEGLSTSIVEGQESPRLLGWYMPHDREPAPVASYRVTTKLPAVHTYLLLPQERGTEVPDVRTQQNGEDLVVEIRGEEFRFRLSDGVY